MTASKWQSKIIGSGTANPADLLLHPANVRIHPDTQLDALQAILQAVGWVDEVIVNQTTGRLLDGHARVSVALRAGQQEIPVSYVRLSPDEELLALASYDRIGGLAQIDAANLTELLRSASTDEPVIAAMLAEFAESAGVVDLQGLDNPDAELAMQMAQSEEEPSAAPARVAVKIGELHFYIGRSEFDSWQEDARSAAGFGNAEITAYMLEKLGLETVV